LNWVKIANEGKYGYALAVSQFSFYCTLDVSKKKYIFNKAKVLLPQNGFQPNIMLVHGDITEAESVLPINY
jgi:hypothetical protein